MLNHAEIGRVRARTGVGIAEEPFLAIGDQLAGTSGACQRLGRAAAQQAGQENRSDPSQRASPTASHLFSLPSKRVDSRARGKDCSGKGDERIALAHGLTFDHVHLFDLAGARSLNRHFHFHRLEDDANLPLIDFVPHAHLDLPYRSGDVRTHDRQHDPQMLAYPYRLAARFANKVTNQ